MTEQTKSTNAAREEYYAPDYTRLAFEPTGLLQTSGDLPAYLGDESGDETNAETEWDI